MGKQIVLNLICLSSAHYLCFKDIDLRHADAQCLFICYEIWDRTVKSCIHLQFFLAENATIRLLFQYDTALPRYRLIFDMPYISRTPYRGAVT